MTKFIYTVSLMVLCISAGFARELELPAEQKTKEIGSLGYGELDQGALTQRVDDLTDVVNTHTNQIAKLDNRLSVLEGGRQSLSSPFDSTRSLASVLNPVGTFSSWGSTPVQSGGGGCTGNPIRKQLSSNLLSSMVSVSEPVLTSVEYGEPIVTSVAVSEPVRYETAPAPQPVIQQPVPVIVQQPQIVRTTPMAMAPLPVAPAPVERRQTVRMPVTRVTTQNVRYEAASNSCPGGVCPVNRSGGFLRRRFRQ